MQEKVIFFPWFQGQEQAPLLVKNCYKSWGNLNPDWQVHFITHDNYRDFVDIDLEKNNRTLVTQSDLLRLSLLNKHGGVWVDGTTFCCQPLDDWLDTSKEFFAFSNPRKQVLLTSWFLYSSANNYLIETFEQELHNFFADKRDLHEIISTKFLGRRWLEKSPSFIKDMLLWKELYFQPVFKQYVKIYPYYSFHYLFGKLYRTDKQYQSIWDSRQDISANLPHAFKHISSLEETKQHIDEVKSPLYKLDWRLSDTIGEDNSITYLFNKYKNII